MEIMIVLIMAAVIVYAITVFENRSAVTITDTQSYILRNNAAASAHSTTQESEKAEDESYLPSMNEDEEEEFPIAPMPFDPMIHGAYPEPGQDIAIGIDW